MPNSEDKNQLEDRMRERREEQQLFQRFQSVATAKLELLSRQIQTTEKADGVNTHVGPTSKRLEFGEEENKAVARMARMGLREGILASIASFVILRRGPKYIGRWVQRRNAQSSSTSKSSYQLSDPKQLNASNNPFEKAAQQERGDFPRPRGFVSRTVWFVFDSVLSLMVGANVSMMYTNKESIRTEVAGLPLVSGRSLVSDALCDDICKELKLVQSEKNPAYERLRRRTTEPTVGSFFMEGIVQFTQNCERRRYVEKRIRQESGLEATVPVEIPTGGVPPDGPRLVDEDNENEMEDQFLTDQYSSQETSWVDDFPSDGFDQDGRT
mmetsp:Transcript_19574/g.48743  ORF Transcript_19574/g.48743 Transcript_19574/m.48743 type:complete len:326 (-) Transcript_19574:55-1032(-)|eukprot:CAMPEP_0116100124 /NCGR_PEP_ID=MMETSP0327-20121206/12129_1 /TAXON_ID=44447 /ORGANISM="Pseudo-nitzschia delicatissima, Strain B596" /LENGTH=325 /DNA_ID=CAMNT_0003592037 /DNA_START=36 /DNA_END=1013 /DNA_ORIENTATION=-